MKKLLSLIAVLALVLSCTVMGIGTVASAAEESSPDDFIVFEGLLEEYVGEGGDVVIPASLGVVEIADRVFYKNEDIVSIVIPEGVKAIGGEAFRDAINLEKITLPYSLTSLGSYSLSNTAITSITFPGKLAIIEMGTCSGAKYLTEINFSYGVQEIHPGAFLYANAKRIVFPETVKVICGRTFCIYTDPSIGKIEVIICNPKAEVGGGSDNWDNCMKGIWEWYDTPFGHNTTSAMYNIYVPEGSKVQENLEENLNNWMGDKTTPTGAGGDDFSKIHGEDETFFSELVENQEDYGIQKAGQTGDQGSKNPDDINNANNATQNNSNDATNNSENAQDDSLTTILIIAIAVVVVIIIVVVVLMVVYMKKGSKSAPKKSLEEEIEDKIRLEEEIRAKVLNEMRDKEPFGKAEE